MFFVVINPVLDFVNNEFMSKVKEFMDSWMIFEEWEHFVFNLLMNFGKFIFKELAKVLVDEVNNFLNEWTWLHLLVNVENYFVEDWKDVGVDEVNNKGEVWDDMVEDWMIFLNKVHDWMMSLKILHDWVVVLKELNNLA